MVGARSMLATSDWTCRPAGTPGPRISSGTRIDGSYYQRVPFSSSV
jgi:hypothetical protein